MKYKSQFVALLFATLLLVGGVLAKSYYLVEPKSDLPYELRWFEDGERKYKGFEYDLGSPYETEKTAGYVINTVGSYTYMLNGTTGRMDYYSTNSSNVINCAIGNSTNGCKISLKAGNYTIDGQIDVSSFIHLQGEGWYNTWLVADDSFNGIMLVCEQNAYGIIISDLGFHGNRASAKAGGIFIYMNTGLRSEIRYCAFTEMYNSSIFAYVNDELYIHHNRFFTNSGYSSREDLETIDCDVILDGCLFVWFTDNSMASIDQRGLYFAPMKEAVFSRNNFEIATVIGTATDLYTRTLITENFFIKSREYAMYLWNCKGTVITNNVFRHCNTAAGGDAALQLYEVYDTIISNNAFFDDEGSPTQERGVYEDSPCDNNRIENNFFYGHTVEALHISGASTVVKNNRGFATENSGTATITSSTTTTFAHGLAGQPDYFWASFNATGYGGYAWTANSTHTTVTVGTSGSYTVYWHGEYAP